MVDENELPDAQQHPFCKPCATAVKSHRIPRLSKSNNICVEPLVPGTENWTFIERLVCRTAHPYQAIVKLPAVMKNLPHSLKSSAAIGRQLMVFVIHEMLNLANLT